MSVEDESLYCGMCGPSKSDIFLLVERVPSGLFGREEQRCKKGLPEIKRERSPRLSTNEQLIDCCRQRSVPERMLGIMNRDDRTPFSLDMQPGIDAPVKRMPGERWDAFFERKRQRHCAITRDLDDENVGPSIREILGQRFRKIFAMV